MPKLPQPSSVHAIRRKALTLIGSAWGSACAVVPLALLAGAAHA